MFRNIMRRFGGGLDRRPRSLRHVQKCRVEQLEDRRLLAITAEMVKDINAAEIGAEPEGWAETRDFVFFSARDDVHGWELWKLNRADGSTELAADVVPGGGGTAPRELTVVANKLFFVAYDGALGRDIWKTDGTTFGATRVTDFRSNESHIGLEQLVGSGNLVYFISKPADTSQRPQLWMTDGTMLGTRPLKDIAPNADFGVPRKMIDVAGTLYFITSKSGGLISLWRTDGTETGTKLVHDDLTSGSGGEVFDWEVANGALFFGTRGFSPTHDGIWITDGQASGTRMLRRTSTLEITAIDREVYFSGDDADYKFEMWRTDGTAEGTTQLTHIGGISGANPTLITKYENDIYFVASDGITGRELWRLDDGPVGATQVRDINPGVGCSISGPCGPRSSNIDELVVFQDRMYFGACDEEVGCELWSSDGTEFGTQLFVDQRPYDHCYSGYCQIGSSDPRTLRVLDGALYFVADDGLHGRQVWRMGADELTPTRASDVRFGSLPADIEYLTQIGSEVWFVATDTIHGREVWRSDGTAAGTVMVKDIVPGQRSSIGGQTAPGFVESAGVVYFVADDGVHGEELWRSDGTDAGTFLVLDINTDTNQEGVPYGSAPLGMIAFGDGIAFRARSNVAQIDLWVSDGTVAGTHYVRAADDLKHGLFAWNLAEFSGQLLFQGYDIDNGVELWASDGTSAGTKLLKDLRLGADQFGRGLGSYPGRFMQSSEAMYFVAWGTDVGYELWLTDGTTQGTSLIQDFVPGEGSSYPQPVATVGDRFYFTAVDATRGRQLWTIDQRGRLIRLTRTHFITQF